jgi:hypothetical protein
MPNSMNVPAIKTPIARISRSYHCKCSAGSGRTTLTAAQTTPMIQPVTRATAKITWKFFILLGTPGNQALLRSGRALHPQHPANRTVHRGRPAPYSHSNWISIPTDPISLRFPSAGQAFDPGFLERPGIHRVVVPQCCGKRVHDALQDRLQIAEGSRRIRRPASLRSDGVRLQPGVVFSLAGIPTRGRMPNRPWLSLLVDVRWHSHWTPQLLHRLVPLHWARRFPGWI